MAGEKHTDQAKNYLALSLSDVNFLLAALDFYLKTMPGELPVAVKADGVVVKLRTYRDVVLDGMSTEEKIQADEESKREFKLNLEVMKRMHGIE